ncbi:hypothetical protein [Sutcliffiella rhizosphaerae]|uniref:Uncharacterized protein n=1 Tax=Sutcliffiella rhizosphaerae TaxID=2880967 RepID=A0ABM8YU34_9BACI|nr:hypothetical protein [Sutcliffiella rhizosphaerae]CAG9623482.1 hypothetical protein BACCIP111883_04295 [Sutcliffiella rhizosphaerae]
MEQKKSSRIQIDMEDCSLDSILGMMDWIKLSPNLLNGKEYLLQLLEIFQHKHWINR